MSDALKHECGIAFIRLRKPLEHYIDKYGTPLYGLNKLYLLMEKQHNRGQDGAGIAVMKTDTQPGVKYVARKRSVAEQPIKEIFAHVFAEFQNAYNESQAQFKNASWLKRNLEFSGEVLLGHLRYGTHGGNKIDSCHPFYRANNWPTRSLVLAGNFNMTNAKELFEQLVELGQHPVEQGDTVTVLEKIGHFLDEEVQQLFTHFKGSDYSNYELTKIISENLNLAKVLRRAAKDFDGGYTIAGMVGNGDSFVMRDKNGIRPAFYYVDDEIVVAASERPCIQTAFNASFDKVNEIPPGHALVVDKQGEVQLEKILEPGEKLSCSFERIYFSRGTDRDVYEERKALGANLVKTLLSQADIDFDKTVFSFIPNTAEVAFYGLIKGAENLIKKAQLEDFKNAALNDQIIEQIISTRLRIEKIAVKDVKMRTFITQDEARDEMVSHVYDITYGSIRPNVDTLVVLDDSIVRGTTLKKSILSNLDRLSPAKIIVLSSAPQIRYPDCYGIDMSKLGDLIAFKAALALLKEKGKENLLSEVYQLCKKSEIDKVYEPENYVKRIYDELDYTEISNKIGQLVKADHIFSEVQVIFQTIEGLHASCPNHRGDWYFTGNYPTPGGKRVSNRAFINFMENRNERAY